MKHAMTWTALTMLAAGLLQGCQTPPPPQAPAQPAQQLVFDSRSADTAILIEHAKSFDAIIAQMPGGTADQHRQLLVNALGELSLLLQAANGTPESPEFANRITVIESAKKTAGITDIPRPRMEAVENQAIGSAYQALSEIRTRDFFDDDQLPPMLEKLADSVQMTTDVMGPMHDLDATETFRVIQATVARISTDMAERFGNIAGDQNTPPAAGPSTAP